MIEFVSLFLGLVVGTYTVEVSAAPAVAAVELRLDDRSLGVIEGAPWQRECDFGDELVPHELVAIARDSDGGELGRARQWLNVPRPRAEARFTLDRGEVGLTWRALDYERPEHALVFFDGEPLEVEDLSHLELPSHNTAEVHFLRAELYFSDAVEAQTELVFGGSYGERVDSELTAVPLISTRRSPPRAEAMQGWLSRGGRPLKVVALERAPANLIAVREISESNLEGLKALAGMRRTRLGNTVPMHPGLFPYDRLRLVFPSAVARERAEGQALVQMQSSKNIAGVGDGTLFTALTAAFFKDLEAPMGAQRLSDAVAVAGLTAAAGDRPRAVLLIITGESEDRSQLPVEMVHAYLRSIRVPLFVWTPDAKPDPALAAWGRVEEISSVHKMAAAIGRLRQSLSSQVIVWVEGGYLPHEIELSPKARGLELVGN